MFFELSTDQSDVSTMIFNLKNIGIIAIFLLALTFIFFHDARQFIRNALVSDVPEHVEFDGGLPRNTLIVIPANPERGFFWPYVLALPEQLDPARPIMVEPNNDGRVGAPPRYHLKWALFSATRNLKRISGPSGGVTLVPVFPRPLDRTVGGENLYTHALTREALLTKQQKLKRIDLQLAAMIDDAEVKLRASGIIVPKRVFVTGFSAAGVFANRWAALHSERVAGVAVGGIGGLPIIPRSGEELTYPLGISDIAEIIGAEFDLETYKMIPMLMFQGNNDSNDSIHNRDSFSEDQEKWVTDNLGEDLLCRVNAMIDIHAQLGFEQFSYVIVDGVGHDYSSEVQSMVKEFYMTISEAIQ